MQKRVYVWEAPVRIVHWLIVLCLLVLSFTGVYIGYPFIVGTTSRQYVMGWSRFIHYIAAYVFVVALAVRVYWAFAGNSYASWKEFFPFSGRRARGIRKNILFYSLIKREPEPETGHTPLAGLTYLVIFLLYLVQIVTGFALYSLYEPQGVMHSLFGWWFSVTTIPVTRLVHHMIMWALLCFAVIHVYIALFLDNAEKNGLVGSIFTGYKFMEKEESDQG
jgi:Ni/Fe-hydrogenase 1 B-type cytochrome subunit